MRYLGCLLNNLVQCCVSFVNILHVRTYRITVSISLIIFGIDIQFSVNTNFTIFKKMSFALRRNALKADTWYKFEIGSVESRKKNQ